MHYSEYDKNLYVVDHLTVKRVNASGFVTVVSNELKEDKSLFNRVSDRHYVYGLWTDSDGNVFVALYGAGKVKKISPGDDDTTIYNSKWGWSPCGGLIDKNGIFWIMEFSRFNKTRVRKVIPNGEDIVYGG